MNNAFLLERAAPALALGGQTVADYATLAQRVARPGPVPDAHALDAHCLDRIARFKRPKEYRFVDAPPKNETGKVLKTVLRERL